MADYRGGGGGGAAVVPASFVVGSSRADYPLTRQGLVDAIAALPAGGGDIYVGAGTLAITTAIALSKNLRIIGAGVGVTIFSVTGAISMFTVGDVNLEMSDFSVTGNNTAAQTFLTCTASITSNKYTKISNVRIGTDNTFVTDATRNIFDAGGFSRNWIITDFQAVNVLASSFYANAAGGTMKLTNVTANGAFSNVTMSVEAVNTTIVATGDINLYIQAKISGCRFNASGTLTLGDGTLASASFLIGTTITAGADCVFAGCNFQATTLTLGATSKVSGGYVVAAVTAGAATQITGCLISGAVTAGGSGITVSGCKLTSFTSSTAGRDNHVLQGNTFTGAGNNVTLTDSDGCVVKGNVSCQVVESATSDSNKYSDISTASTLVGASSVVTDADRYAWNSPGTLTTTDNANFARPSPQVSTPIRLLEVNVVTAPTGATITVDFRVGTKSTGALGAVIGTVTVAIGAFTGNTTVSPAVVLASTQFIVPEITQVGSATPGANATMTARA